MVFSFHFIPYHFRSVPFAQCLLSYYAAFVALEGKSHQLVDYKASVFFSQQCSLVCVLMCAKYLLLIFFNKTERSTEILKFKYHFPPDGTERQ